jgi:hypothetical protein
LKHKVNHAISNNEPLLCIGFQLPDFSLSDLGIISKEFTIPVYFNGSQFFGKADFYHLNFKKEVNFDSANFQEVSFNVANFQGRAFFRANFQRDAYFIKTNFQETADFQLFAIWMMVGSPLRITSPPKTRR